MAPQPPEETARKLRTERHVWSFLRLRIFLAWGCRAPPDRYRALWWVTGDPCPPRRPVGPVGVGPGL